jgi:hypothetical protein
VPATSKLAPVPTTEPPAVADIPAPIETPPTRAVSEPAPDPAPAPDAYYANCTAAPAAGAAPPVRRPARLPPHAGSRQGRRGLRMTGLLVKHVE